MVYAYYYRYIDIIGTIVRINVVDDFQCLLIISKEKKTITSFFDKKHF